MNASEEAIEKHRTFWAEIANKNGWYIEPFYTQA
jgi:hypothetical protein